MLGIRCPDRHALSRTTPSIIRRPRCVLAPARAGSFFDPNQSSNHPDKLAARVVTRGLLVVGFGSTV